MPGEPRFLLRLPASQQRAREIATPAPRQTGRGRVLVVDDEEQIRKALRRVLGRHHDVVTVASAREARALLEVSRDFDMILCDVMMPEMTGVELHGWLVATAPTLAARVVFLSGGAFNAGTVAYLASVENPKLEKPFDTDSLRAIVAARGNERGIGP